MVHSPVLGRLSDTGAVPTTGSPMDTATGAARPERPSVSAMTGVERATLVKLVRTARMRGTRVMTVPLVSAGRRTPARQTITSRMPAVRPKAVANDMLSAIPPMVPGDARNAR